MIDSQPSDHRRRLRMIAFVVLVIGTNAPPFAAQVLGIGEMGWRMFHVRGVGQCDARFELVDGATRRVVDPFSALGYSDRSDAPLSWRRPENITAVLRMAERYCRVLDRPADLRLRVRCATADGWDVVANGEEPVCRP